MNLQEIIDEARSLARDEGIIDVDRLWPDSDMVRYANRVQNKIARDTLCIKDATTVAVCLIQLDPIDYLTYAPGTLDYIWANDPDYPLYQMDVTPYLVRLHDSILEIEEVKTLVIQSRMTKASSAWWRQNYQWEATLSQPYEYATDLQTNMLALLGRSETSETLQLAVKRMPLTAFVVADMASQFPDIRPAYHDFFMNGILALMYSKQDAETIDKAKAADYHELHLDDLDEIKRQERLVLEDQISVNNSLPGFR